MIGKIRGMAVAGMAGIVLAVASLGLASPRVALAEGLGRIHVEETSVSGEPLPSSTIMVYDSLNVVVGKSINENGLSEFDLPKELTDKMMPNKEYTITAVADGYAFDSKKGKFAENADTVVKLTGVRTVSVRVQLSAEGVNDFSYVRAAIYEGSNVSVASKSTASPSKAGEVEFTDVPVGSDYTIMLTCPSNLAGQLPELTPFSVPADQKDDYTLEIKGTAAALDTEEPVVTEVPEPLQKYEAPEPTPAQQEQQQRPMSTQPIAQTGDAVLVVTLGVIGVAVVALVILIIRRK